MPLKFCVPSSVIICGPSMSGKSELMFEIIAKRQDVFQEKMGLVIYCYGCWSVKYEKIKEEYGEIISFVPGIPSETELRKWCLKSQLPIILVLDDLLQDICQSRDCQNVVTRAVHHCHISMFIITQNLFANSKIFRTISLNTHYFLIMKLKRDLSQIYALGRQIDPLHPNLLMEAYTKATQEAYGYLRVDLHPSSDSTFLLTSAFLSDFPIVYLPDDKEPDYKTFSL